MLLFHGSVPSSCQAVRAHLFCVALRAAISDSATTACMRVQPPCQPEKVAPYACPARNRSTEAGRHVFHLRGCLIQGCHAYGTARPLFCYGAHELLQCEGPKADLQ